MKPPTFFHRMQHIVARFKPGRDGLFVVLAALIGLVMGTVATAFIVPLHWMEAQFAAVPSDRLIWLVPVLPAAGGLLAGLVGWSLRRSGSASGVPTVIYAIHRNRSQLPLQVGLHKWIGSTVTLGSGGSGGAEGPIVTIGAVVGSNISRLLHLGPHQTATMLGCGAAAGIASVFNAPLAGIFFVLEILLRDFSLRTFTPIVIAAVISAVWTQTMLQSNEPLFGIGPDFFREGLQFMRVEEIPNYLLLGAVCGLVAVLFGLALNATGTLYTKWKISPIIKPMTGGLLLGLLGLGYIMLIGTKVPDFYGNGYPVITDLLDPASGYYNAADGTESVTMSLLGPLVLLAVFKALATCLTIGSGGLGGLFAPSLLLGAATGGTMGVIVNALDWFPAAPPAYYALVGMAAMIAATTHAPLTGILIVYEVTQRYEIILPIMFAAVIATGISRTLHRDSVYTSRLSKLGLRIGAMSDLTILRRLAVSDVPLLPPVVVRPDDSAQRLVDLSERHAASDFVVTEAHGAYIGVVTASDLREALVFREAIPLLQVNEIMRTDLPTLNLNETLDVVLDKFSEHDVQALPVLDERTGRAIGLITRSRLMRVYQRRLSED